MTTTDCKYPNITVAVVLSPANAYSILAIVSKALRDNDLADEIPAFLKEATSGDYDHLLQTCMKWVNVE